MTSPHDGPAGNPGVPPQPYQPAPPLTAYPTAPGPYQGAPQGYPSAPYGGQPFGGQPPYAPQPHGGPQPPAYGPRAPLPYKDSTAAWLLWFFLGYFGAHHFYLGRNQRGTVYAVTAAASFLLSFVLIGFLGWVALFVLWIIDATQLNQRLTEYNAGAFATNRSLGLA